MPKQKSSKFNASKSMKDKIKQFKPIKESSESEEMNEKPKQKEVEAPKAAPVKQAAAPKKAISLADIKDEEMMAAALVATIDYHEETKEDVRVVSIKEIK